MLKKLLFSVDDCETPNDATVKGVFIGLAVVGAASIVKNITTLIVRKVVRDEIERL